jgi:hypothetical protein
VNDKLLGRRGVGWHTVVCYGGPERFRRTCLFGVDLILRPTLKLISTAKWGKQDCKILSYDILSMTRSSSGMTVTDTMTANWHDRDLT